MKLSAKMAIGASVLAVAFAGGSFVPASATETAAAKCASNRVCFWTSKNYKGTMGYVVAAKATKCWQFDATSNKMSSLIVGSKARIVYLYDGDHCKGAKTSYYKTGSHPSLGNWDNRISSVAVKTR
jgi:hypothetical protein